LQPADIVSFAPRIAGIYGQPFGNSSVVPTFFCAKMARADGVQAMIAGDGGDELFGGNSRYATQQLFSYYTEIPAPLRRYALEPLAFKLPGARSVMPLRKLGRYIEQALEPMPDRLQTYNYLNLLGHDVVFEPDFLRSVDTANPKRAFAAPYDQADARSMLNKKMALDLKITLTDNDLPKVVEACGAAAVQVAFPFLEHEVVEFAARLPARQKVSRLRLRYFFKKALGDFLPVEIIRKKKHGFGMPFGDWILVDKPLHDLAFDSMSALKRRGIVRAEFIDDLCNTRLRSHPNYYGGFMWILMILELWAEWHASLNRRAVFGRSEPHGA
jgi:asparagine synthase (glutamine-hydrolysing)